MRRRSTHPLLDDASFERLVREILTRSLAPAPPAALTPTRRKKRTLNQIIRDAYLDALKANDGNVSAAARELGVARSSVQRYKRRFR
jgi:transcriptional regulator of acetoin/glycerol metabolism